MVVEIVERVVCRNRREDVEVPFEKFVGRAVKEDAESLDIADLDGSMLSAEKKVGVGG